MTNLDKFGVQELNSKEINQLNGGIIPWIFGAMAGSFLHGLQKIGKEMLMPLIVQEIERYNNI